MIKEFAFALLALVLFVGCAPKPVTTMPRSNNAPSETLSIDPETNQNHVRYVALGDSYTIGFDVETQEAWPSLVVDRLQAEGIGIQLVDNLAVSGYKAIDVIEEQLPVYRTLQPQFATILVGANDLSLGVTEQEFQAQFSQILDEIAQELENKKNIVVLTIPDFTQTPRGRRSFSNERYATLVENFNRIIVAETTKRDLPLVDLSNINDEIGSDDSFFTGDGLHPSAKQYVLWADRIFPVVKEVLLLNR
jgi:lysophospholipase L1-like esterase